jgi:hypothetical protein
MSNHTTRDRLVYPAVAILAIGLVSVPPTKTTSAPRLAEISAIQLQAEAPARVAGIGGAAATEDAAYNPNYSLLSNFLWSLPEPVQNFLRPPLMVFAGVLGAVMAVVYTIIGWDRFPLIATAASASAEVPGVVDPAETGDDQAPVFVDSVPAVSGEDAPATVIPTNVSETVGPDDTAVTDNTRRGRVAVPAVTAEDTPAATAGDTPNGVEDTPAATAENTPSATAGDTPASVEDTPSATDKDTPASVEDTPAATDKDIPSSVEDTDRRSNARGDSSEPSDSSSPRAARRSATTE